MTDLIKTIAIIVVHTPIWVWALYAVLLLLGLQRTCDSVVPLVRLLILPIAVAALAISSLVGAGVGALSTALIGFVVGGAIGWQLEREGATRRLANGRLWLRGEWWSFTQIAVVLIFRYVTNVVAVMEPTLNTDPTWHAGTLFVSSALSALLLGRTAARLAVYFRADEGQDSVVRPPLA